MMVASSTGTGKGIGGKGVRTTESPLLQEPLTDVEDALAHETNALDIALASGHGGAINHDVVCDLLIECLYNVCSSILAVPYLFALLLVFYFSLFLWLTLKLTRAAKIIIIEDSEAPLCKRIVELEEDKNMLQCDVDHSIEDYILMVMGNKSLLHERNELKCRCEDL
jgi:hypothetical protein